MSSCRATNAKEIALVVHGKKIPTKPKRKRGESDDDFWCRDDDYRDALNDAFSSVMSRYGW